MADALPSSPELVALGLLLVGLLGLGVDRLQAVDDTAVDVEPPVTADTR